MSSHEISLASSIETLLSDEELSDVILEGSDSKTIPALRGFLAARSPVFRRMLFGEFVEAKRSNIRLGYNGDVIRAIVEYCYCDKSQVFTSKVDEPLARTMVDLSAAADYFELPILSKKSCRMVRSIINEHPSLACAILDQAWSQAGAVAELGKDALQVIRGDPSKTLLPSEGMGVLSLKASTLEYIIADEYIVGDELTLFKSLKKWAEDDIECRDERFNLVETSYVAKNDRQSAAIEIAKNIRLDKIAPSDLCAIVAKSGLVTKDQLFDAFQKQAIQAEKDNITFSNSRFVVPYWKGSNKPSYSNMKMYHTTEFLKCKEMTTGVHIWSIEIIECCNCAWVGVACTVLLPSRDSWLGKQKGGWAYGSNGAACHDTGMDNGPYSEIYQSFRKGNVVTLRLDLTGSGTLSASVDDNCPTVLFQDMIVEMECHGEPAFVPAISLRAPGSARLISFGSYTF